MSKATENKTSTKPKPKPREKPLVMEKSHIDFPFFILVLLLLIVGLVALFSASHAHGYYYYKDSYNFIYKQVLFSVVGVGVMIFASLFDYRLLEKLAWPLVAVTLALLVMAFRSKDLNQAHRWIILGPFPVIGSITFQPSEIAKFSLVLIFALLIKINEHRIESFKALYPFIAILGVYTVLIVLEPHLSGTLLVVMLGGLMLFIGGARVPHLLALGGGGGLALFLLLKSGLISYTSDRIDAWRNPWNYARGIAYQNVQALYAIGSGGAMGVGIGNSRQKITYLPEPHNDFIFAVICEEVGFIGATIIILLYALLIWRGFVIATRCPDRFGSLLVIGLVSQVGIQVLLNIMVVTMMVPNTGISLPFFSAGGTSLIMLLGQMGVVLSISQYRKAPDPAEEE